MWHLVTRRHWEEKSPTLAVRNFSDLNAPVSADELQSLAAAEKGLHNMLSALKLNGACRDRMLVQISKMINRKELNSGMHKANWQACFQEAASGWCQLLLARRSFENTPRRCIACTRGAMFDQLCIHKRFKDGIICINKETELNGWEAKTKPREGNDFCSRGPSMTIKNRYYAHGSQKLPAPYSIKLGAKEAVGNSLGRAPLGGSGTEARMDRKLWEIAWSELPWEQESSVNGKETVGNNFEILEKLFN